MGLAYYVIDTETTGISSKKHEVTEISVIRCSDRHQITRQIRAEFPERATPKALEITGRTIQDILQGEEKEVVVQSINEFIEQDGLTPEHRCMIGHNVIRFDKNFCHALWEKVGSTFPAVCWLDTMKVAKEMVLKTGKKPENYQLSTLVKFAGITPMDGIHDAGSDTRNTYLFWKKSVQEGINPLKLIKRIKHNID